MDNLVHSQSPDCLCTGMESGCSADAQVLRIGAPTAGGPAVYFAFRSAGPEAWMRRMTKLVFILNHAFRLPILSNYGAAKGDE
jgi:hypothetical protein